MDDAKTQIIYINIATGPMTKMTGMSKMTSMMIMHCGQKLRNLTHDSESIIDYPVAISPCFAHSVVDMNVTVS